MERWEKSCGRLYIREEEKNAGEGERQGITVFKT